MKKLTTAFAALAVSVVAMAAPVPNTGISTGVKVSGVNPEHMAEFQALQKGDVTGLQVSETRSYVNSLGKEWEIALQITKTPLCEMLTFSDAEGNPVKQTFDQMPFYLAKYTLSRTDADGNVPTVIIFNMAWPSMYIYDQVWNYDGPLTDNKEIPVEYREYSAVPLDVLANNENRCHKFQEAVFVGPGEVVNGMWSFWSMLPNEKLGSYCLFDEQYGYTELSDTRASSLDFTMYDPEESWLEVTNRIYIYIEETGSTKRVQESYKGTADIEGFAPVFKEVPEFGDVHLFNTGIQSSDAFGDSNPFPGEFSPLTAFYFVTGDKYLGWEVDPTATTFDMTKIHQTGLNIPTGEKLRDHANYVRTYLYASPEFAKDTELNPETLDFTMIPIEEATDSEGNMYAYIVPEENSCLPYGVNDSMGNYEPWSLDYGFFVMYRNMPTVFLEPTNVGWGYKDGLIVNLLNSELQTTYQAKSTGKLFYYYDPNNMQVYRELSLTGGKEYNSVEGVEVAEESAPVYYNLNGVRVDGSNLAKGIYVKVSGNKAQKVLVK